MYAIRSAKTGDEMGRVESHVRISKRASTPVDKLEVGKVVNWTAIVWKLQVPILSLQMHRNVSWLLSHVDWCQTLE